MPLSESTPMCNFIPKYHWFPLRVWCISGSRALARFLVDEGALMILASTTVPCLNCSPSASRWRLISSSNPLPSAAASSRWRKLRIVVSSGIASESLSPTKRCTVRFSYSASSIAGSLRLSTSCTMWTRSISESG